MSLLTRISNIFSRKQVSQQIGIALQQHALSLCFIPEQANDDNKKPKNGLVLFKERKLKSSNYSEEIAALQNKYSLSGRMHLVLNEQLSQIVQVDKPSLPEAEIIGALKWQIKDLVTISPDNMVLDYYDAPMQMGGNAKINVVCAPLTELRKIVHTISKSNIQVSSIITQEFAFSNLLPVQDDACLLVCQQPNEEIVLIIVKRGQLYFNRRLRGFSQISSKTEDELTMTVIDNLSLEIQRSTDYFERQLKQAAIKEIKVLIPMPLEGFFARKLSENTNVPVTLLALPSPYKEQREYAVAIGATIVIERDSSSNDAQPTQEQLNVR